MQNIQIDAAKATGRGNHIILEILKAVLVFISVTILSSIPTAIIAVLFLSPENTQLPILAMLWSEILGIGLILLYCRFIERRPLSSLGFIRKNVFKSYLKGFCMGFGMITSVVIVGTALNVFRFVGFNRPQNVLVLLLFLGGFLIQGMFEEVMCRGYFMISAARKNSIVTAIIANSLLFSILHVSNNGFSVIPFINLLLFGLFASIYMLKTENIWGISALHSAWNYSLGCVYGLSVSGMDTMPTLMVFESAEHNIFSGSSFGPEGGIIVTIVLCVELLTLILFRDSKKRKKAV